jgi:hypothetical protein
MTAQAPQTPAHGEVDEIRPQVAETQDVALAASQRTLRDTINDLLDVQAELDEAREMVAYLTRANEALAAERDELRSVLSGTNPGWSAGFPWRVGGPSEVSGTDLTPRHRRSPLEHERDEP